MGKHTFEDTSIVAFLSLKNYKVTPQRTYDGKVVFIVEGKDINRALQELYGNSQVGVLDFIKTLKALRSSIFALKAGGER
ncbi:MAG: hypothetical protein A2Y97_00050 [Nitrospirae bacterium RBG_13_39_12]|nr:MAG: hypothetical protein A2Y97_00050 [Nitrospirae bacterium RBG_13_39_12]